MRGYSIAHLREAVKPFRLHFFATLGSTNTQAAKLRRAGKLYAPALVVTSRQTAGRGRGNNRWWSSAGVMTATFVFPIRAELPPHELPLLVGLALRAAAVEITGDAQIQLKWPNDLQHNGQKLAGLLCERIENADLVGIGLNVNLDPAKAPPPLRRRITSLRCLTQRPLDPTTVLATVARHLYQIIQQRQDQPFAHFTRIYAHHDALAGKTIRVISPGDTLPISGECLGIDETGRLLLRLRGKVQAIISGHVMMPDE